VAHHSTVLSYLSNHETHVLTSKLSTAQCSLTDCCAD